MGTIGANANEPPADFVKWLARTGEADSAAWTPTAILLKLWHDHCAAIGEPSGHPNWVGRWLRTAGVEPSRRPSGYGFRFRVFDGADATKPPDAFVRFIRCCGAPDSSVFTPASSLLQKWRDHCKRSGQRPGTVCLFRHWACGGAGIVYARRRTGRGYRYRFFDVETVKDDLAAAVRSRKAATISGDEVEMAAAIAAQRIAERQAGGLLELDVANAADFGNILGGTADRWRKSAMMSDVQFAKVVKDRVTDALSCLRRAAQGPRTRMVSTPWRIDADGTMTRELTAVDADAQAA